MDFGPEIIMVTPSYMLAILDEFRRQGIDPKSSALRLGFFGAEPWGEGIRNEIETAFGIDACDIYGLSEVMGPGVAQEIARTAQGPTIWEDHFLVRSSDMPVRPIVQAAAVPVTGNTEVIGWMLYTSYLIPFEIASMLLLVAM